MEIEWRVERDEPLVIVLQQCSVSRVVKHGDRKETLELFCQHSDSSSALSIIEQAAIDHLEAVRSTSPELSSMLSRDDCVWEIFRSKLGANGSIVLDRQAQGVSRDIRSEKAVVDVEVRVIGVWSTKTRRSLSLHLEFVRVSPSPQRSDICYVDEPEEPELGSWQGPDDCTIEEIRAELRSCIDEYRHQLDERRMAAEGLRETVSIGTLVDLERVRQEFEELSAG